MKPLLFFYYLINKLFYYKYIVYYINNLFNVNMKDKINYYRNTDFQKKDKELKIKLQ